MPGTYSGGVKAAKTNKELYGDDFYVRIGAKGGTVSRGGGFAYNRELAREAGRKGGKNSSRARRERILERLDEQEAQSWMDGLL